MTCPLFIQDSFRTVILQRTGTSPGGVNVPRTLHQKVNVWAGGIHVPPVFSWQTSPGS
jgi:hypothetical protein